MKSSGDKEIVELFTTLAHRLQEHERDYGKSIFMLEEATINTIQAQLDQIRHTEMVLEHYSQARNSGGTNET
jgi:hypothetical protein